jgi:hypothetical protein
VRAVVFLLNTPAALGETSHLPKHQAPTSTLHPNRATSAPPLERGAENDVRGTLAQDEFKTWCTYNDLTANRATEDKEGWDFFVEFKSSNDPRPFLGHAPSTCRRTTSTLKPSPRWSQRPFIRQAN